MDFVDVLPVFCSFAIVWALGPFVIPLLRRLKFSQTEREELQSHQNKMGTPTMGGVMILLGACLPPLFYLGKNPRVFPVVFLTLGFGIIGFLDDYLKVVKRNSDGLLPWQKMILQIVLTSAFAIYMVYFSGVPLTLLVPFSHGYYLDIGFLAIPVLFIAVIGTVNGTNFTDGLDGLCSTVTVVVALFFMVVSLVRDGGITPVCLSVAGALMGFLVYNAHPAKVFMGDTGSLALGGFVAASAYMMQMPLFIIIVGLIYLVEVLSVIIQVGYFKATHGKRVFRMAPIHHHFELGGWSETRVVTIFSIITLLLCFLAFCGL